jgi:Sulfotransferase family
MKLPRALKETGMGVRRRSVDPIPVLFIAGAGRSGSTLLDRVIGTHEGFRSMGELHFIWERSYGQNQLCGCGLPFHECSFWEEVSKKAFGVSADEVDDTTAVKLKEYIGWKRYLCQLALPRNSARYQSALLDYGDLLERLYGGILSASRGRVIVDSSKDPVHGLILSKLPGFELHVVHLVRDPRAVAFSWKRSRRRPEIHWEVQDMPIENIYTSAIRWSGQNILAELLGRLAQSYSRVRYEDFVAAPTPALARIFMPYEWMGDTLAAAEGMAVELEPTHTVSGNPMRFKHGEVKLTIDSEWLSTMSPYDRRSVTAVTWPFLARYGYPLQLVHGAATRA